MDIKLGDINIQLGTIIEQSIPRLENDFIKIVINSTDYLLKSKRPMEFSGARFRLNIFCKNKIATKVSLVAMEQQNIEYQGFDTIDEIHKKWLRNEFGEPMEVKQWGYIYRIDDLKICSEFDPRSGSSEIIFEK